MFTARYGLSPYITRLRFVLKGLTNYILSVFNNIGRSNFNPDYLIGSVFTLRFKFWCVNCMRNLKNNSLHYNALQIFSGLIVCLKPLIRELRHLGPEYSKRGNAAIVWRCL